VDTGDQGDAFLAKADQMAKPGYATLFRLTAGSAIRIDEARRYEPSDIDVKRGLLTITPKKDWTTKGYRYRDIPISEQTIKALLAFVGVRDKMALDDKAVWNEIQRATKRTLPGPSSSACCRWRSRGPQRRREITGRRTKRCSHADLSFSPTFPRTERTSYPRPWVRGAAL
jgi:integrase